MAEVRGARRPGERFVFSAHVQEPGANDNASGVGALAEMARVTAKLVRGGQQNPLRTITFLWGDEISSTARFLREDSVRTAGVRWGMSLDMVGEDTERREGPFSSRRCQILQRSGPGATTIIPNGAAPR